MSYLVCNCTGDTKTGVLVLLRPGGWLAGWVLERRRSRSVLREGPKGLTGGAERRLVLKSGSSSTRFLSQKLGKLPIFWYFWVYER